MKYLLYVSKRPEFTTDDDVERIIDIAEKLNAVNQITGILLIRRRYFIQYFEGSKDAVEDLLKRLQADSRHRDMLILERGEIDFRLFPEWRMLAIRNTSEHKYQLESINRSPLPNLRHLLHKYFVLESPPSIAFDEFAH